MEAALLITLLWVAFGATHITLSSMRLRPRIVGAIGERPFQGLYSLIAFATLVPLIWIYFANKHAGPWLWEPLGRGAVSRWGIYVLMGTAFTMLIAGGAKPSPASVVPGAATVTGIHRITRHPVVMGLGLFGLTHLLPNGSAADVAFFGGFLLFALIGARHQDQRKLRTGTAEFKSFHDNTVFIPFTGRDTLKGLREIPIWAYAAGVGITIALRYLHTTFFGGGLS